jgi:hypothetical protein
MAGMEPCRGSPRDLARLGRRLIWGSPVAHHGIEQTFRAGYHGAMSESATRMADSAATEMRMLHELRMLRDAEQYSGTNLPMFRLRKGTVTAPDPATYTVSVLFGAADESDFPGIPVPGIHLGGGPKGGRRLRLAA